MKKKIYILSAFALLIGFQNVKAQATGDVNVSLSNISSNNGFDTYDDNTKMVSGLFFEILSDGNSTLDYVSPFKVTIYLLDPNDPNNPIFLSDYDVNDMHQMSARDYSGETVDLSSVQLPAGTYRLGVYVDSYDDIPNPPDDPSDNAYLVDGNIYFTPGSGTSSVISNQEDQVKLRLFPNPVTNQLNVDFGGNSNHINRLEIQDLNGQVVKTIDLNNQNSCSIDVSNFANGVYILSATSSKGIIKKKFVVK